MKSQNAGMGGTIQEFLWMSWLTDSIMKLRTLILASL